MIRGKTEVPRVKRVSIPVCPPQSHTDWPCIKLNGGLHMYSFYTSQIAQCVCIRKKPIRIVLYMEIIIIYLKSNNAVYEETAEFLCLVLNLAAYADITVP
jgi:hypothetical protein